MRQRVGMAIGRWAMAAGLVGAAVPAGAAPARTYPYQVVATVGMVADVVTRVAGERAEVTTLIGEGVDPHLYKPSRGDVAALLRADVVFYSGLLLEGRLTDALQKVARGGRPVYAVTELIDRADLLPADGQAGHYDPHVWMDVAAWMKAVEAVARALAEYDPAGKGYYDGNAVRYLDELRGLDDYVHKSIATIPPRARVLVTAHDAFRYFGRAYGLEVRGIQGISTESEAGLNDIVRLVDLLVQREIPAVFVETSVAEKNVKALVEGARARRHAVAVGGSLFSDALGPAGAYEGTYLGMIDHNATVITRALGGQAPERGWKGELRVKP